MSISRVERWGGVQFLWLDSDLCPSGKTKCLLSSCCLDHMFMALEVKVDICPRMRVSHLCPLGAPAAAELRESSAGGAALQRGLAAGSDRAHRAAED